ncbi:MULTISPECIES: ParB/RepB/Spo0J family partition protein [Sphingomonas]|uniref:ParB/RepB/Spo0J family partition protein n=1 Tax=Sphingomonas TaxID=13687 RepID=UPI000DEFD483|nr:MULTISPECIES: ParB/RepB/Spo0J family partition protein [Sphingomonas]
MNELRQRGLGRGLSALLGDAQPELEAARGGGVREIDVGAISPNPQQPRQAFDDAAIAELAASIAERGVLQPILVRDLKDGRFELIAGERRWRASQRAQLHKIPALVREFDAAASAEVALIENVQREDLNALEEADAYASLIERYGHGQDAVAKLVGKSRSHVANLLRLRDLPEYVRELLRRGELSMGHARAVASAEDPEALAREVISGGLSVRQTEQLAKAVRPGAGTDLARGSARNGGQVQDADVAALERQLGDVLGLRVKIAAKGSAGTVTLHFSTLDQLDLVCQRLTGEPI